MSIRVRYYPLLNLLRKYDWTIHPNLRKSRNDACMLIRVHGSHMDESMFDDMLNNLIRSSEKIIIREENNHKEYVKITEQIKKISELH